MPEALELDETKKSRFFVGCGAHEPFFLLGRGGTNKKSKKTERETAFDFNLRGCVAYRLRVFSGSAVSCVE